MRHYGGWAGERGDIDYGENRGYGNDRGYRGGYDRDFDRERGFGSWGHTGEGWGDRPEGRSGYGSYQGYGRDREFGSGMGFGQESSGGYGYGGTGWGYPYGYGSYGMGGTAFGPYGAGYGGYGGYGYGNEQERWGRDRYRGDRYDRDDKEIRDSIYDAIDNDWRIPADADIDVTVEDGVCTLKGKVRNRWIKGRIGQIAWDEPGIRDVHNNVDVRSRWRERSTT